MDVRYFFLERLRFVRQLYLASIAPFVETKRKIEDGEAPYEPLYSEDDEPPFLSEWMEAEDSIQAIGSMCISMLATALHLYLNAWQSKLGLPLSEEDKKRFKKRGWFQGYQAYFKSNFGVDFGQCPSNLSMLEEIILARNQVQNPEFITQQTSRYSEQDLKRVPAPYFADERHLNLLGEDEENRRWLLPPSIRLEPEKLDRAIQELKELARWLDETNH